MKKSRDTLQRITFIFMVYSLFIGFTSLYSQDTTGRFTLQSTIQVESSLGDLIDDAIVSITLKNTGQQETIYEQTLLYESIGNGRYRYEGLYSIGYYEAKLEIRAPGHFTRTERLSSVPLNQSFVVFSADYVRHCNEGIGVTAWLPNRGWNDCEVDPDRLIETFGQVVRNLPNTAGGDGMAVLPDVAIHKYLPTIRNDGIAFISRYRAYKDALERLSVSYALFHSYIYSDTMYQALGAATDNNMVSLEALDLHSAAFAVQFSSVLQEMAPVLSAAGYGFDLMRVRREGQMRATLLFVGYVSALERFIGVIEARIEGSWLANDRAFQDAFGEFKAGFISLKDAGYEDFVDALVRRDVNAKIGEILAGKALNTALGGIGFQLSSILTGGASAGMLAAAIKAGFVFFVSDFGGSVMETGRQHALLLVLAQMDRELLGIYADSADLFHVENHGTDEQFNAAMRIQTGLMFNEIRASLLAGDFRTWLGRTWQYLFPEAMSQQQAYRIAMAITSNRKMHQAENDLIELGQILQQRLKPEMEVKEVAHIDESLSDCGSNITDIDGNSYRTVQIGNQFWMAENLNTGRYRDGSIIQNAIDIMEWRRATQLFNGAWAYYDNNISNGRTYGKLYNWYAVSDQRGLCPRGWKVPSDQDWKQLEMYLGMLQSEADAQMEMERGQQQNVGGKLKAKGNRYWSSPNTGATNESGFSALPGGLRFDYGSLGSFFYLGKYGYWWSSSASDSFTVWGRILGHNRAAVGRAPAVKRYGFSVRCIRD